MGQSNQKYDRVKESEEPDLIEPSTSRAKPRDLIGFFLCGLINNFGYVVMLSAAEDLLHDAGVDLPPSVVLLADILPSFIIQLTGPWFMHYIPYSLRVIIAVTLSIASFLLPAFFSPVPLKLLGVVCAAVSSGFGEITFLSYSSHFNKNTVSTWSSGTGGAGILGSVSYLGLRYLFSAKITLIVSSWLPLIMALSFFVIISKPEIKDVSIQKTEVKGPILPASQKLRLMWRLLPYMIPLAVVYYGEYLINQSIAPVLYFHRSSFNGREYQFYQAIYQVGVFISRSSVNFVPIKNIYLLQLPAIFQTINMVFLSIAAVYDFIPSIWIIFAIILWEGLLGGSIYVNTFYLMSQNFEGAEKEFCLGATSMSYGLSITLCAITGIFYTPFLSDRRKAKGHYVPEKH